MKKIFTLAALLATCWCSSSAVVYTDVFDYDNILAKCTDVKTSTDFNEIYNSSSANLNESLYGMYTADTESGAHYSLVNVFLFDVTSSMYTQRTIGFPYDAYNSELPGYYAGNGIHNVVPPEGKWIKSVSASSGYEFSSSYPLTVYYSAESFTFADRFNVGCKTASGAEDVTVNIDEPAQYVYIVCNEKWIYNVTIEWTDEKPVPTVATPEISCYANPIVPGSNVDVKTATVGATVDVKVAINGVDDGETRTFTQNYEWGSAGSFQLPGVAGDEITVTAVASKTDWVDSEVATAKYTLAEPPCPSTTIDGAKYGPAYLISGQPVTFAVTKANDEGEQVDIEGAKITFTYNWDYWDEDKHGTSEGETTVDAPYQFTIPTDIPVGAYLNFSFTQIAPGYSESTSNAGANVVSKKIAAPTLNTDVYTDVEKGTVMSLNMPKYANKLYYTINGGEAQMSESWYEFTVEENMTIEAWAEGEAPFEPSDKVTFEITLETLTDNIDVILPESIKDDVYQQHYYDGSEHNGANSYLFYGGYWAYYANDRPTFYQNLGPNSDCNFLANLTAGQYEITGIRIDCPDTGEWGSMAAVYLADEPLVTVDADGNMTRALYADTNYPNYDLTNRPGYFVVCSANNMSYDSNVALRAGDFNQWIDLKEAQAKQVDEGFINEDETELSFEHRKYFLIRPWVTNGMNVFRYLIRYNSAENGVSAINADLDTEEQAVYYNLSGVRVDGKLTPGLYIRVTPASTTKVLVK